MSQREKQLASYSVKNNKGRNFSFNYTVTDGHKDGHHLKVDIVITTVRRTDPGTHVLGLLTANQADA